MEHSRENKENAAETQPAPAKRGRGRPRKNPPAEQAKAETDAAIPAAAIDASAPSGEDRDATAGGTRSSGKKRITRTSPPSERRDAPPSAEAASKPEATATVEDAAPEDLTVQETEKDTRNPSSAAKTPASLAEKFAAEAITSEPRGPVTRSASKSLSDSKKSAARAAAAAARAAGRTPGVGVGGPRSTMGTRAETPGSADVIPPRSATRSFGKKLAAVADFGASPVILVPAPTSDVEEIPLFSNQLYEQSAQKEPAEASPAAEVSPAENASSAATLPTALPTMPKFPGAATSFVPLVRVEEKPSEVAAVAADRGKADGGVKVKALQAAEAAKQAEARKEEERKARKEALMAARQTAAATTSKPPAESAAAKSRSAVASSAASKAPGPAKATAPAAAAAGSVMERLQRAMESRSRLEAENRKKLEMDQKRKEEERRRREKEANERRAAKDAAEAKEREEKQRRHEKLQQARKEQEEAQRAAKEEQARMRRLLEEQDRLKREGTIAGPNAVAKRKSVGAPGGASAEEKKRRLQDFIANNRANAALGAGASAGAMAPPQAKPSDTTPVGCAVPPSAPASKATPTPTQRAMAPPSSVEFSYQISPYRENSDSEDEDGESRRPRKPVPSWARSDALGPVLRAQAKVDPDDIFPNPSKTCSLDAVFTGHKSTGSGKSRRSSSGNWFHDRLTWKEELTYKREMGFVAATNKQ